MVLGLLNWARANSLWVLPFGTSRRATEPTAAFGPRHDVGCFGVKAVGDQPQQADLLVVAGRISHGLAPQVIRMYGEISDPK